MVVLCVVYGYVLFGCIFVFVVVLVCCVVFIWCFVFGFVFVISFRCYWCSVVVCLCWVLGLF
jgi:hypothetical protein